MKIVAIDPSVNDVGWAVIKDLYVDVDDVIHSDRSTWEWGNWELRSNSYTFKLREIVDHIIVACGGLDPEVDWLVIEWPMYYDTEKGQTAARQGNTITLAGIAGYIAGFFRLRWQNIHFIKAPEWKGSLSKEITRQRFFRHMGIKQIYKINHNAVDAVMMLLWFCKNKGIAKQIVAASAPPYEIPQPD